MTSIGSLGRRALIVGLWGAACLNVPPPDDIGGGPATTGPGTVSTSEMDTQLTGEAEGDDTLSPRFDLGRASSDGATTGTGTDADTDADTETGTDTSTGTGADTEADSDR